MAPSKRRGVGRVKDSITLPPTSTHAVNTCGFAALADEIYLEIVSHLPSVPIPTSIHSDSYPEIRRSRHETFLSLTQTSRSLRRFFWRYLWQRIEVREGIKIGDKDDTLKDTHTYEPGHKKYAIELVRQLEIVTIRNPLLAQYVNYLDIFVGNYSIKNVLAELARCLSLFPNLHTVQIVVCTKSRLRSLGEIFEHTFEKYSYPQIRNVFVVYLSVSFVASCPQARRIGLMQSVFKPMYGSYLQPILRNCPQLEVLEDLGGLNWPYYANYAFYFISSFPNLRSIHFRIFKLPFVGNGIFSYMYVLKRLKHLQTIILTIPPKFWHATTQEIGARTDRVMDDWIETAKRILIHIQLCDNLEKTIVIRDDSNSSERRIVIKPKSSVDLEEGSSK